MMKRMRWFMMILIILSFAVGLTACGNESNNSDLDVNNNEVEQQEQGTSIEVINDQQLSNMNELDNSYIVDESIFQETSFNYTDPDGYEYRIKVKISPWILYSQNEKVIPAIWNVVDGDKGNVIPEPLEWIKSHGMNNTLKDYYSIGFSETEGFRCRKSNYDMYYALGNVSIENVTQNFHITADNSRSVKISCGSISFNDDFKCDKGANCAPAVSRIFYTNNIDDHGVAQINDMGFLRIASPLMEKDKWGPVSFIIGHGESTTPNEPDGLYKNYIIENNELVFCADKNGMPWGGWLTNDNAGAATLKLDLIDYDLSNPPA